MTVVMFGQNTKVYLKCLKRCHMIFTIPTWHVAGMTNRKSLKEKSTDDNIAKLVMSNGWRFKTLCAGEHGSGTLRVCNFPDFSFPGKREKLENPRNFPGNIREFPLFFCSREFSRENPQFPGNSRPGKSREQTLVAMDKIHF